MIQNDLQLRPATTDDLDSINQIILTAVISWDIPERVKRLALPSYYYTFVDLQFLQTYVVTIRDTIIAVLAIDDNFIDSKDNQSLLIHGIYVHPDRQNLGVGRYLFEQSELLARSKLINTLQVKAQKDAEGFFTRMGMKKISSENNNHDYSHLYWKTIT